MFGFDKKEHSILRSLKTPQRIQNFLDGLEINFEPRGDTCMSPRRVLREGKAHCMEGAMFAAAALRVNGYPPLVVDMTSNKKDFDHVVAVFKENWYWGAISKTNHAVLKYRDPIFKNIRELVMSYFNEYFLDNGKKTLRSYSNPVNLKMFDKFNWITSEEDVWVVPEYLARVKHIPLFPKNQIKKLRRADPIEIEGGKIVDWKIENNKIVRNEFKVDKEDKATL